MPPKANKGKKKPNNKLLCAVFNCQFPFVGSSPVSHKKRYHHSIHNLQYNGSNEKIVRRSDGKCPCPCGHEQHARYDWMLIYTMCRPRKEGHPKPGDRKYADIEPQISVPLLNLSEGDLVASGSNEDIEMGPPDADAMNIDHVDLNTFEDEDIEMDNAAEEDKEPSEDEESDYESDLPEEPDDIEPIDHETPSFDPTDPDQTREYLAQYGIAVDPVYRLVICLECRGIADYKTIVGHRMADLKQGSLKLTQTRLPPSQNLLLAISSLGGSDPRAPDPSEGPIDSIYGVRRDDGLKCTISGCVGNVYSGVRTIRKHQQEDHPDVPVESRSRVKVKCHALCMFRDSKRKYIEVTPKDEPDFDGFEQLKKAAEDCGLFTVDPVFKSAETEGEKGPVLAQTRWDSLVVGVDVNALTNTASTKEHSKDKALKRLQSHVREYYKDVSERLVDLPVLTRRAILKPHSTELDHVPFRCPQEKTTVVRYADLITRFISFLITNLQSPIESFPVILHPQVKSHLLQLCDDLGQEVLSGKELILKIHEILWFLLRYPSDEYKASDTMCPFTRFLIAAHIKDGGGFDRASVITPHAAGIQWCFRATSSQVIIEKAPEFDGDTLKAFRKYVAPWISEVETCMFNSLRQSMHFLSALAYNQQGLSRFTWSFDRHTLSMNGFPIHIPTYIQNLTRTLSTLTGQIGTLFRGCPFVDILEHLDSRLIPDQSGCSFWLREDINNEESGYSLFEEEFNGLKKLRSRLLDHLVNHSKLFDKVDGELVLNRAQAKQWLYELDEIVRGLFYMIVTTWGGGARGSEMVRLLYANMAGRKRNVLFINGLYTFLTEYAKMQSMTGHSRIIARTAAYQTTRLLLLVLLCAHYAAGYICCYMGMENERCIRYFHEIFVYSGHSMKSEHFSDILGEYNALNTGVELKLADFRQFMACVLIASTNSTFPGLDSEDENVIAAHQSFNHSVNTGRSTYGLEEVGAATTLAPDAVAIMQQVCLRWQAFIRLIHPILHEKIVLEDNGAAVNSDGTNALIKSLFRSLEDQLSKHMDSMEQRIKVAIRQEIESLGTHLTGIIHHGAPVPSYANPKRMVVHESAREALRCTTLRRTGTRTSPEQAELVNSVGSPLTWTSPEQAELVNSVGSPLHVFGILETGAGKSVSFFGAPFLLPKKCFIVVSPLVALTQDLAPRLLQFGIRGGVFGQHEIDSSTAQLVIVSAHKAGTDKFYDWAMTYPIRSRLHRIFIDEAQKILTDKDYRQCFKLFWRLIEIGVPVTCLSGSLMPRSMPLILNALEIRDPSLVDEIRRYTGRPNLKYVIEKLDDDKNMLPSIKQLQEQESKKFKGGDRGIIFVSTHVRAAEVQKMLGCPMYTGRLSSEEREDAVKRWKEGIEPSDRWMVATEAFGQGVDYAHVRCTIHDNPKALLNYVQETGRAGRDRLPAICHTVWSMLPYIKEKDGPDHEGRADMARLLPTTGCIRLSFAPLDRVAHSCIALDAQLCSNCEKSSKIPYHLTLQGEPRFDRPLVPSDPTNPSSSLVPMSVETNAAEIHSEREAGYSELVQLNLILRHAYEHGCLDCFVDDKEHKTGMNHYPDFFFNMYIGQLDVKFVPGIHWPFCWVCWVPFRAPCGHAETKAGVHHDTALCLYQTKNTTTEQYCPIIPTLIVLIFMKLTNLPDSDEQMKRLAKELGVDLITIRTLNELGPWITQPVGTVSTIPNHARYLLAWYKLFRKVE